MVLGLTHRVSQMKRVYAISSLFILSFSAILSGCATSDMGSAKSGGAIYEYQHQGKDGSSCSIKITSAREVGKGQVKIAKDCSMSTDVDQLGGVDGAYQLIKSLADKIPTPGNFSPGPPSKGQ